MTNHRYMVSQWLAASVHDAHLDDSGIVAVKRSEGTVVVVEVPTGSETCHFYALIAPLPEDKREAALLAALELNRFGRPLNGSRIAWENDIQMLTLCHNLHIPSSDVISFGNALDNFMTMLEQVRAIFIGSDDGDADLQQSITHTMPAGIRG